MVYRILLAWLFSNRKIFILPVEAKSTDRTILVLALSYPIRL